MKNIFRKIAMFVCTLLVVTMAVPAANTFALEGNPRVIVTGYELSNKLVFGEENTLNITLKNTSKETYVTEVLVTVTSSNGTVMPAVGYTNQIYVEKISAESTTTVKLPVVIYDKGQDAASASVRVQYTVDTRSSMENTSVLYFPFDNASSFVYLKSYSVDDALAGKETYIHFTFANMSATTDVDGMFVTFTSNNTSIIPVAGNSNQFVVPAIKANSEITFDLPVVIPQNATGYAYMTLNMQYLVNGASVSNTANIMYALETSGDFDVKNIYLAKTTVAGSRTLIGVNYRNTGKNTLSKVTMLVAGIDGKTQQFNLGSIEGGQSLYAENYVTFDNSGNQTLTISFTFEDADGNTYSTKSADYEITVSKRSTSTQDNTQTTTEETSSNSYTLIFAFGVVAVIFVLAIVLILKKRK